MVFSCAPSGTNAMYSCCRIQNSRYPKSSEKIHGYLPNDKVGLEVSLKCRISLTELRYFCVVVVIVDRYNRWRIPHSRAPDSSLHSLVMSLAGINYLTDGPLARLNSISRWIGQTMLIFLFKGDHVGRFLADR
jgi:hypothetical protein